MGQKCGSLRSDGFHGNQSRATASPLRIKDSPGFHPCVRVSVGNLAGDILIDELVVPMNEKVMQMKVMIENLTGIHHKIQKLVLDSEILRDDAFLSAIKLEDGDRLILVRCKLPSLLYVKLIDDSVQVYGVHKLALQKSLEDTVDKIEVTVEQWADQGWGNKQARLFIYLHDPADHDCVVAQLNLFGCLRTDEYDMNMHQHSPSRTVGPEEEVVSLAKPGMVYKLKYEMGGGGGHTIRVQNWKCNIFPPACSNDEALDIVAVDRVGESGRAFERKPEVGPDGHRL